MSKYQDIPIIDEKLLSKKYEVTEGFLIDPDSITNSQMDALKFNGTDKPLFEEEFKKDTSINSLNRLNLMQHGSRYDHAPYHPEVFLGEVGKDPRHWTTEPNLRLVADQNAFRFKNYYNFLSDASNNVIEGVIPERKIMEKRVQGFYDTQRRLNIFEDSQDNIIRGVNNFKKPLDVFNDTEKESDKYIGNSFELVNPQRASNRISQLSNQVGDSWLSVPDNKFGVSSYTNLYRTKSEVDSDVSKVLAMSKSDHKRVFPEKQETVKESLMQLMDNVKKSKRLNYSVNVEKKGDSHIEKFNHVNKDKTYYNHDGSKTDNTIQTQKRVVLENYLNNRFNKKSIPNGIYKNRMTQISDIKKSNLQSEISNISLGIPKNKNLYYSTIQERKLSEPDKEIMVRHISQKMLKTLKDHAKPDTLEENKRANFQSKITETYKQVAMKPREHMMTNVIGENPKNMIIKEILDRNKKSVNKVVTGNLGNAKFDTEASMDNKTFNHSIGRMGSKYLKNQVIFENEVNPVNEMTTYRSIIA